MEQHFALTDFEFENSFADCSLDAAVFTHEAHLRLGWIHLQKYGIDRAIANITSQLKAFVLHAGSGDKYNMTLTVAAVKIVYHFMQKSTADDFANFIATNPRLKSHFRELVYSHYSTNIFTSPQAKQEYLEPELLPFD
jgi:hypothetical protein